MNRFKTTIAMTAVAFILSTQAVLAQSAPLKVAVTIKPIHALVMQVMDGTGAPTLIVDGTASPHTYALKPSDAKALNDADIVFRISETLEAFTAKVVRGLPKSVQVITLEEAPGVVRLKRRTSVNFAAEGHAHGHDHGAKGKAMDGHVWLDPNNAKAMVAHIAAVLAAKRPASADTFKANAAKATARLDVLSAELAGTLKSLAGKPYVVFHDALQYLETRYGLTAVGAVTADPETPPSGKRLADLRKKVATLGATCVFSEPNFETRVVQSIIEGSSARAGVLDPEGALVPPGAGAYDAMMRALASSLKACLAPPA